MKGAKALLAELSCTSQSGTPESSNRIDFKTLKINGMTLEKTFSVHMILSSLQSGAVETVYLTVLIAVDFKPLHHAVSLQRVGRAAVQLHSILPEGISIKR